MGAVETLPAVAEGQTAVPAVASTMVAAGSDDVPAELRVSDVEAGFFRFDSFPPVVEDLLEEPESEADEPPPSPELLARRARLRKAVGAVVAAFATLAVVAGAVGAFRSGGPGPMAAATMAGVPHEQAVVPQSKLVAPKPKRAVAASPGATSTGSAEQLRDPAALRLRAVALLSAHELDEAAAVGREIIALEPDHAFGYRCLGAALQDQGKWSEALDVYGACAGRAKRGEVGECVALGGRR